MLTTDIYIVTEHNFDNIVRPDDFFRTERDFALVFQSSMESTTLNV